MHEKEEFVDFRRGPVSIPCGGTRMAIEAERKDVSGPTCLREAHARSGPCLEGSGALGTGDVADYRRTDHLLQTPDFYLKKGPATSVAGRGAP